MAKHSVTSGIFRIRNAREAKRKLRLNADGITRTADRYLSSGISAVHIGRLRCLGLPACQ